MQISLVVQKMVIQFKKRNKIAVDLFSKKYRKRVVGAKKGRGSFKRKKKLI